MIEFALIISCFAHAINGICGYYSFDWNFGPLRNYLMPELMWDPYMTEEEFDGHIKKFMEGFYGDGWEKIYEAFYLWTEKETGCHGFRYNQVYSGVLFQTTASIRRQRTCTGVVSQALGQDAKV